MGCGFICKPDPAGVQVEFEEPAYSAVLLLEGGGDYVDRGTGRLRLQPGDLVHRIPGRWHRTVPDQDGRWREFFILLPAPFHAGLQATGLVAASRPVWRPGLDARMTGDLFALLPAMRAAPDADLGRLGLAALAWLGGAHAADRRGIGPEDPRLAAARLRLAQDLDRDLDLARLAADLGMGYTSFRRWFGRETGRPPGAWRLAARLERARTLLATTGLAIAEVARCTGFCDRYAFTRAFTAAAGCPPAAFRRRHGG